MTKNHIGEEPIGYKRMPNGGTVPVWSDGTIGTEKQEDVHREYLRQHQFGNLDEYDEQVLHDNVSQSNIDTNDVDKLETEIADFEKLADRNFIKERHVLNLRAEINHKKKIIDSQLKYMRSHNMQNTSLYKKLESLATRLKSIQDKLKDM